MTSRRMQFYSNYLALCAEDNLDKFLCRGARSPIESEFLDKCREHGWLLKNSPTAISQETTSRQEAL
jgi:hypothetical protein